LFFIKYLLKIKDVFFENLIKFYTFWNKCSFKETHLVWKLGKSQQNLTQFMKRGRLVSRKMIDRLQFLEILSVISKPSGAASCHGCQHPGNLTKIKKKNWMVNK